METITMSDEIIVNEVQDEQAILEILESESLSVLTAFLNWTRR